MNRIYSFGQILFFKPLFDVLLSGSKNIVAWVVSKQWKKTMQDLRPWQDIFIRNLTTLKLLKVFRVVFHILPNLKSVLFHVSYLFIVDKFLLLLLVDSISTPYAISLYGYLLASLRIIVVTVCFALSPLGMAAFYLAISSFWAQLINAASCMNQLFTSLPISSDGKFWLPQAKSRDLRVSGDLSCF